MTGYPIHIEVRTNPEYKYDSVLSAINYNFEYINANFSGGTSGNTLVNGLNTYVTSNLGSTAYNVSGLSIDNIFVSGSALYNVVSATTIYADNTIVTGNTLNGGSF